MQHPCGCVNMIDEPTGAIKNLLKCDHHKAMQRPVEDLDEAYYRELGALDADSRERYRAEFVDGFGQLPEADGIADALEIGGGFSPRGIGISGLSRPRQPTDGRWRRTETKYTKWWLHLGMSRFLRRAIRSTSSSALTRWST